MAKLVDAYASGAYGETLGSSSLPLGTKNLLRYTKEEHEKNSVCLVFLFFGHSLDCRIVISQNPGGCYSFGPVFSCISVFFYS